MYNIIDFQEIIFDNSLIMAIIAINMTIIGLTSLAESKSIVGIDYGKFLVRKYKVLNFVKIYQLLVIFAIVNVSSLFLMFVKLVEFRVINLCVLVLSLVFAIFYFFNYIIIENKWVRKQIIEQEILGLYYNSDRQTTFEVDRLVEMSNGSGTHKKISSNIVTYFSKFDSETQHSFEEIFGVESILYDYSKSAKRKRRRLDDKEPYCYRKSQYGIYDISHEFFQLFRYSELQDKWIIDILRLFSRNSVNNQKYDVFRIHNFARIITHINVFGRSDDLYKYKFLEHLIDYYYSSVNISDEERLNLESPDKIRDLEWFVIKQLFDYIFKTINSTKDNSFLNVSIDIVNKIILHKKYKGLLSTEDLLIEYLNKVLEYATDDKSANDMLIKQSFMDILYEYYTITSPNPVPEKLGLDEVRKHIESFKGGVVQEDRVSVKQMFDC